MTQTIVIVCLALALAIFVRKTQLDSRRLRRRIREYQLQEQAAINWCCCAVQRAENKDELLVAFRQFVNTGREIIDDPDGLAEFMSINGLTEVQHMRNLIALDKVIQAFDRN